MVFDLRRLPNCDTHRLETKTPGHPSFRSLRHNKNDVRSTHILVARNETRHREQSKRLHSTACFASGKNLRYQLPKKYYGKLEKLTEPGQELQIEFTGKLHNKNLHGEVQILIAVDRFSKWPTVKICKTAETKEVTNFLSSNFHLNGIPEKIKSDK